jgi:hypothetical protein
MVSIHTNFLSTEECDSIVDYIKRNKNKWYGSTKVIGTTDISVLGAAYFRSLINNKFNTNLALADYDSHLQDVDFDYSLIVNKFKELTGYEVKFFDKIAKPGFQIISDVEARPWHYDDEKLLYPYQREFADYTNFDYFDKVYTLTIMLTNGEFTYDYTDEVSKYKTVEKPQFTPTEYKTIHYSRGDLVLTEDRYYHRVGLSNYSEELRMTLQGHAVVKNETLYLYW